MNSYGSTTSIVRATCAIREVKPHKVKRTSFYKHCRRARSIEKLWTDLTHDQDKYISPSWHFDAQAFGNIARASILKGIRRGEMAVAEGNVVSHADAKKRMTRWLNNFD